MPSRSPAFSLAGGWSAAMPHSAHAEPLAAGRVLAHLGKKFADLRSRSICCVVDHLPMVTGQRRWHSLNGGFSANAFLNAFFSLLYAAEMSVRRDVFHVDGKANPVDGLSRSVRLNDRTVERPLTGAVFPSLAQLFHPYEHRPERPIAFPQEKSLLTLIRRNMNSSTFSFKCTQQK